MKYWLSLILALVLVADANAGIFGFRLFRRSACVGTCAVGKSQKSAPAKSAVQKSTAVQKSEAVQKSGSASDICLRKARIQAARGRVFHPGGSFGGCRYEGCGSGRTAAQALANCCWTGRKRCVGSAVVQGKGGMFFATKLFVD